MKDKQDEVKFLIRLENESNKRSYTEPLVPPKQDSKQFLLYDSQQYNSQRYNEKLDEAQMQRKILRDKIQAIADEMNDFNKNDDNQKNRSHKILSQLSERKKIEEARKKVALWQEKQKMSKIKNRMLMMSRAQEEESLRRLQSERINLLTQIARQQRRRMAEQKLILIQERKQMRNNSVSTKIMRSLQTPRYKKYEREFHEKEEQKLREAIEQKRKYYKKINLEEINSHEKNYLDYIGMRRRQITKSPPKRKQFTLVRRESELIEKQIQRIQRRKQYDKNFEKQKRLWTKQQLLQQKIRQDKEKNPSKYFFLKKTKNLTDQQIFEQKQYQHINAAVIKEKGNQYLKQARRMRNLTQPKREQKSLLQQQQVYKNSKKYINYLPLLKKEKQKNGQIDEIDRLVTNCKSKLNKLNQKQQDQVNHNLLKQVEKNVSIMNSKR